MPKAIESIRFAFHRLGAFLQLSLFNDASSWLLLQVASSDMVEIKMVGFRSNHLMISNDGKTITGYADIVIRDQDAKELHRLTRAHVKLPVPFAVSSDCDLLRVTFVEGLFDSIETVDSNGSRCATQVLSATA